MRLFVLLKSLKVDASTLVTLAQMAGLTGVNSVLVAITPEQARQITSFVVANPGVLQRIAAENLSIAGQHQGDGDEANDSDLEDSKSCFVSMSSNIATEATDDGISRSATSLMNAVASDMFRGFDHFAVIELGALFETFLCQIDGELEDSGLAESIRRNCDYGMVD